MSHALRVLLPPLVALVLALQVSPAPAASFEVTERGNLVVLDDGSLRLRNEIFRIAGIRLPRARQGECRLERDRGQVARQRLESLLATGKIEIEPLGTTTRSGYKLARVLVARDDLGQRLLREGIASEWRGGMTANPWCR